MYEMNWCTQHTTGPIVVTHLSLICYPPIDQYGIEWLRLCGVDDDDDNNNVLSCFLTGLFMLSTISLLMSCVGPFHVCPWEWEGTTVSKSERGWLRGEERNLVFIFFCTFHGKRSCTMKPSGNGQCRSIYEWTEWMNEDEISTHRTNRIVYNTKHLHNSHTHTQLHPFVWRWLACAMYHGSVEAAAAAMVEELLLQPAKNEDIKHIMIVIGLDVLTLIFMWVNACTYSRFDLTLCHRRSYKVETDWSVSSVLCVSTANANDSINRKKTQTHTTRTEDMPQKPFIRTHFTRIHLTVPFMKATTSIVCVWVRLPQDSGYRLHHTKHIFTSD